MSDPGMRVRNLHASVTAASGQHVRLGPWTETQEGNQLLGEGLGGGPSLA